MIINDSISSSYFQPLIVVMTTQIQHWKMKTKTLKVQIPIKKVRVKVMEKVKIKLAPAVKKTSQVNNLSAKDQPSGGRLLRQLFWHCPKNAISQNLQGQTYLNFWEHLFLSQTYHHQITPLRKCWLK